MHTPMLHPLPSETKKNRQQNQHDDTAHEALSPSHTKEERKKTMRKILTICAATLMSVGTFAQQQPKTFSVTPQVGVSLGKQNDFMAYTLGQGTLPKSAGYNPKANYKAGLTAGAELTYQATKEWAFSLGAFYTQAGSKYKDFEAVVKPSATDKAEETESTWNGHAISNMHNSFDYITVPVMAHYRLIEGLSVKAGVELGFLVNAKREWDENLFTIDIETNVRTYEAPKTYETDIKDEAKGLTVAIPVGISYEYEHVVLDARYHIPLTKSMKNIDTRNRLATITVGYRF